MRPLLSLKTLFRTPLKTFLTFLLIAAASFAIFSRVADLAIISREMARVSSFYRGVCALDTGVPDTSNAVRVSMLSTSKDVTPPGLTKEEINAFASLKQVTSVDTRYMTAGIINGFSRYEGASYTTAVQNNVSALSDSAQDFSYSYTNRFIVMPISALFSLCRYFFNADIKLQTQ